MKKSIFASYILTTLMLSSVMFTLVFSTFMISPVGAQDTTIGVEPAEIVSDSTFTVEIWIRGVVDLADFEFMLGYDTAVLMATSVEYGGIFGDTYFELGSGINDIEGWVGYGCMEMFGELGFTGDGIAATVTFTVDSHGSSNLDLYETYLGDSNAEHIPHTVCDECVSISPGHDVAVVNITAFPTSVPQGEPIYINVTVENQGTFTETFDVNVSGRHWGTGTVISIGTETVYDLPPGASEIVNFVWDTTDAPVGTYDLIAEAILPTDDDPEDNILIAKGIIAGITVPYTRHVDWLALVVPMVLHALTLVAAGIIAVGFFKLLASVRPPRLWLSSKRSVAHKK